MEKKPIVLFVDDDAAIRRSVVDILELSGYETIMAQDGAQAITEMATCRPDIIISDIMMPIMDGYEFYEAVRTNSEWVNIPFIILSARGEKKDLRHGTRLGVDSYLTKPFEPEDLLLAIDAKLKRFAEVQEVIQEDVERTKEQLLNVFSHELRTPLSIIHGYSEFLADSLDTLDKEKVEDIVHAMQGSVKRLVRLVEDLMLLIYLDCSGSGIAKKHFQEQVNIRSVIKTLLLELESKIQERQIKVKCEYPKDILVIGNHEFLTDLFSRLLDNAIKFNKQEGAIWIKASRTESEVRVSVCDSGIGIAAPQQARLFEPFTQIDRKNMEQQGIGLGLAITKRLVQLHGGELWVESEPGKGSTFTVSIPAPTTLR